MTPPTGSAGTKTPRSREMRGVAERPPPTRTANPGRPSLRTPTRATSWISGALHWAGQALIVYLCLRGRLEYSRLP
jgi:hypothetical protein